MRSLRAPVDLFQAWQLRAPERFLLFWTWVCIALGFLMLWGSTQVGGGEIRATDLLPLGLYAASLILVHLTLVTARFKGDQLILVAVAFLSGLGILAQYRMGSFATQEGLSLNLALFPSGFLVMSLIAVTLMSGRFQILMGKGLIWVWGGLSVAILLLLLAFGQRFRGGVYAFGLITPSEALKITTLLFLAGFIQAYAGPLSKWSRALPLPAWRPLLPLLGIWIVLSALLLIQRDLGLLMILSVTLLIMLSLGTGRLGYLIYGVLAAAGLAIALLKLAPHAMPRIQAWLDPFRDPTGNSWQILQGLSGMYSGGLWGEGFGRGSPEYTPIAQSDFIYAVIGEELGFVGCLILLIFFLLLLGRGFAVAARTASSFGRLLALGVTTIAASQIFLNVAGVTKLVPLTGIPLPFISHGGSSLMTTFMSLGLLLAISDGAVRNRQGER